MNVSSSFSAAPTNFDEREGPESTSPTLRKRSRDLTLGASNPPRSSPWPSHRSELLQQVNESKKRTSSKVSPHLSTAGGPPPSKKLDRRHRSRHEFHKPEDQSPPGPLFFSHQSSQRPSLPYRLSSSEAGAKMLSKANKEDTGSFRTLKLARGSVGSPSRPSGQRTPSGSGRSYLGSKPKSPANTEKSNGLNALQQVGVLELLEQDERPTFILDLDDQVNYEPGPLKLVFANASLRASAPIWDMITGRAGQESPRLAATTVFSEFKAWSMSYVKNHESLNVAIPSFSYAGSTWTTSSLRKRFRVVKASPASSKGHYGSNPPSMGFPSFSSRGGKENDSSLAEKLGSMEEEAQDYFGNATDDPRASMDTSRTNYQSDDELQPLKRSDRVRGQGSWTDSVARLPPLGATSTTESVLGAANAGDLDHFPTYRQAGTGFFDWTRLPNSPALARHIQFARSIDWSSTALGPIVAAQDRIELSQQLAMRTQEAVESETKFTRMAEFAPVGIFIADSRGKLTYINDKWYDITKVPKGLEGTDEWMNSVKEEDQGTLRQLWSDLVSNGIALNAEVRFKTTWIDQNGNKGDTWVLANAFPEKGEDGTVKIIFGTITDISQQKWAEYFEKRRMEEAVEMKRQQENFIDITSHEMRNPLSAILQCADEITTSLTELQTNDFPQGVTNELLKNAVDASGIIALCAQHQKRIVDDILTLSKLDSALLLVTPCDIMPKAVVEQALKMFDGEVHTADINLNFKIDDSIMKLGVEWVKLDPSRLLQVLINLTTNAIKFTTTQEKRIINVTMGASSERPAKNGDIVSYFPPRSKRKDLAKSSDWGTGEKIFLHFAVQDTGRGLNDDEKKLLFIRFSQASPRTHVQYGGSGLGLFISRELVELQGGEIGVASKAGEGSTFAFYIKARRSTKPKDDSDQYPSASGRKWSASKHPIPTNLKAPCQGSENSQTSQTSLPQGPAPEDSLKILVVEDNPVNQKVLSKQLRNMGCIVHVANHGGECLDRLRASTFWKGNERSGIEISVILMDQEMPVMDGLTCTKEIRKLEEKGEVTSHVPIISVTANARSEQIITAMEGGMDDVVSKPFRLADLIPKVEELTAQYPYPTAKGGASQP